MRQSKVEISVGDKIGTATVINKVYNKDRKEWEYICRCVCGNVFKSRKDHLLKPRKGCAVCMGKGKVRINTENLLSESDYKKAVAEKILEKTKKEIKYKKMKEANINKKNTECKKEKTLKRIPLTDKCWIGKRFGMLTVVDSFKKDKKTYWKCVCDCGNTVTKVAKFVKIGSFISCGCKSKAISLNSHCKDRLYRIWNGMKSRCNNKNVKNYKNYGGRGIKVCEDWNNDYLKFKEWAINNGWDNKNNNIGKDSLSIERIDVNGNYEPDNCCFIKLKFQCLNKRPYNECDKKQTKKDTTMVTINGETKSLRYWQEYYKISNSLFLYRTKKLNLTLIDALTTKKHDKNKLYKKDLFDKNL